MDEKNTTPQGVHHRATVDNPRGHRSSWTKLRSVEDALKEVCAELGEDLNTFTRRVCDAVHERPRRIAELQRGIRNIRERLADGRFLPHGKNTGRTVDDCAKR